MKGNWKDCQNNDASGTEDATEWRFVDLCIFSGCRGSGGLTAGKLRVSRADPLGPPQGRARAPDTAPCPRAASTPGGPAEGAGSYLQVAGSRRLLSAAGRKVLSCLPSTVNHRKHVDHGQVKQSACLPASPIPSLRRLVWPTAVSASEPEPVFFGSFSSTPILGLGASQGELLVSVTSQTNFLCSQGKAPGLAVLCGFCPSAQDSGPCPRVGAGELPEWIGTCGSGHQATFSTIWMPRAGEAPGGWCSPWPPVGVGGGAGEPFLLRRAHTFAFYSGCSMCI